MNDTLNSNPEIKISILMHKQDDPTKCTAEKLVKFKMARQVNKIPFGHIILNPFSKVIITNKENANEIMNKFKWGHTFIDLNHNILEDYSHVKEQEKIIQIEKEYFPNLYK